MSSSPLAARREETRRALRGRRGQWSERGFRLATLVAALLVLAVVVGLGIDLAWESRDAIARFGAKFLVTRTWDPVHQQFGALPYIYGTIVPAFFVGVGAALFLTDLCPRRLRTPLASLVELLAAIPSVVYGLWGIFVLAPLLRKD